MLFSIQICSETHPPSCPRIPGALSLRVKLPEREVDNSSYLRLVPRAGKVELYLHSHIHILIE
jgi:hypothetical protein